MEAPRGDLARPLVLAGAAEAGVGCRGREGRNVVQMGGTNRGAPQARDCLPQQRADAPPGPLPTFEAVADVVGDGANLPLAAAKWGALQDGPRLAGASLGTVLGQEGLVDLGRRGSVPGQGNPLPTRCPHGGKAGEPGQPRGHSSRPHSPPTARQPSSPKSHNCRLFLGVTKTATPVGGR